MRLSFPTKEEIQKMKEIQEKIVILPKETMVELELISRDSFKEVFGGIY